MSPERISTPCTVAAGVAEGSRRPSRTEKPLSGCCSIASSTAPEPIEGAVQTRTRAGARHLPATRLPLDRLPQASGEPQDRKSTRLNSSHGYISYAVFCLKKKKKTNNASSHLSSS